ncbi:MAG: DUF4349 domain-containing protein [Candidatus Methanoperedens sp.]|nr:DUF4349 domain-containing protein [Candidatus Methanoperedens sp.]
MNKKLVVIAAVLLLIVTVLIVSTAFNFGLGGTYDRSYDQSYSNIKKSDLSDQSFAGFQNGGFELSANSIDTGKGDRNGIAISMERKIISTAHLQLEVDNVPSTVNKITNITQQQGGFISGSSVSGYEERKNGQVTVRVPQKNFYAAVEQIEALGTVKSRDIRGQDVTEQYIDINARLGNFKKQEERLQDILKMANTVKDVLEIERELNRVRGEIESLTGKLNYLDNSIEMSTITVDIDEPAPFFEGWGITNALKQSLNGFFDSISGLIVFTGFILPIAIYLILIIFIGMGVKRNIMPRLFGKE